MMRLIDADALRDRIYHEAFETDTPHQKWDSGCWIRYKMFERNIKNAPTVDAVPVVRCKDCKYKYYADNRVPNERCWVCDKSGEDIENMEWFCPYGEKEANK